MIRATTGGVLRGYRYNLMNSFINTNKARDTVLSQRNFNSYAEDPASAAKAFRLRKSRMTVKSQYDICNDTYGKFQGAWSCLESVSLMIDNDTGEFMSTIKGTTLEMLNDPTGDARTQLSKALDQISQTIVQTMNQKYGDNFIFAGADGHNVPFEVREDNKLYYRGIPVDAAVPKLYEDAGGAQVKLNDNGQVDAGGNNVLLANFKTISKAEYDRAVNDKADDPDLAPDPPKVLQDTAGNPYGIQDADGVDFYILADSVKTMTPDEIEKATKDAEKLEYVKNEKLYLDIGLGFQENEQDQLIPSSAYNAALHGIDFIGSGQDADGDPKNIYSIVQKLKEISDGVPEEGKWDEATWEEFAGLVRKLETAASDFKTAYTNMDAGTTKLKNNVDLLKDNFYNLQEQYAELEDVDMADAITSFVWAQYCYNAALKVGNSVLSESLMDYLN